METIIPEGAFGIFLTWTIVAAFTAGFMAICPHSALFKMLWLSFISSSIITDSVMPRVYESYGQDPTTACWGFVDHNLSWPWVVGLSLYGIVVILASFASGTKLNDLIHDEFDDYPKAKVPALVFSIALFFAGLAAMLFWLFKPSDDGLREAALAAYVGPILLGVALYLWGVTGKLSFLADLMIKDSFSSKHPESKSKLRFWFYRRYRQVLVGVVIGAVISLLVIAFVYATDKLAWKLNELHSLKAAEVFFYYDELTTRLELAFVSSLFLVGGFLGMLIEFSKEFLTKEAKDWLEK